MGDQIVTEITEALNNVAFANGIEGQVRPIIDAIVNRLRDGGLTDERILALLAPMSNRRINVADELYEALATLVADWDSLADSFETVPDEINVNEHWDAARSALAKAEGR